MGKVRRIIMAKTYKIVKKGNGRSTAKRETKSEVLVEATFNLTKKAAKMGGDKYSVPIDDDGRTWDIWIPQAISRQEDGEPIDAVNVVFSA